PGRLPAAAPGPRSGAARALGTLAAGLGLPAQAAASLDAGRHGRVPGGAGAGGHRAPAPALALGRRPGRRGAAGGAAATHDRDGDAAGPAGIAADGGGGHAAGGAAAGPDVAGERRPARHRRRLAAPALAAFAAGAGRARDGGLPGPPQRPGRRPGPGRLHALRGRGGARNGRAGGNDGGRRGGSGHRHGGRAPVNRALVLLLLLALPLQVLAANAWLTRIGPALRGLDYRGTLVVVADGRMETLRVFHRNDEGRERERLVALSGPPRELVRDGERVVCVGTGGGDAAYPLDGEGHWRAAIALGEGVATEAYDIALGGQGRVAGYPAQILEVRAGDRWRYGYRLWLEQDSGLPLRVDLLDAGGRAVERVAFTELELGVQPSDEELSPSAAVTPVPTRRASPLPPESVGWLVRSPPPGFVL